MPVEITRDVRTQKGAMIVAFERATQELYDRSDWEWSGFRSAMNNWTLLAHEAIQMGYYQECATVFQARNPLPRCRSLQIIPEKKG